MQRCLPQGVTLTRDRRLLAGLGIGLTAALLTVALLLLRPWHLTVGLDQASFAEYGDLEQFFDTRAAVYASQAKLMATVDNMLVGEQGRDSDGKSSEWRYWPVDSGDRFRVASDVSFYDSEERQLSLTNILAAIRSARSPGEPVPAALHYFLRENVTLSQTACIRSAVQQLKPSLVFLWPLCSTATCLGGQWTRLLAEADSTGWSSSIIVAHNARAERTWRSSYDLEWLQILIPFGGILLDPNVYVMRRPPDLLRHRVPVVGRNRSTESAGDPPQYRLSVDVVISPPMPAALFLWRMALRYRRQQSDSKSGEHPLHWPGYNASALLQAMADQSPELLRQEPDMYLGPSGEQRQQLRGHFVRVL